MVGQPLAGVKGVLRMARKFDDWLKAYMQYTQYLEAPDEYHFWAGVAAIAGALRGKCWFDMGYFKWKPNFFIVYVAPPGMVAKSTTIGQFTELLREVPGVHFGPDSSTWQGVTDAFMESKEEVQLPEGGMYTMCAITLAISELGTFLDMKNREMVDVLVDLWDGKDRAWERRTRGAGVSAITNPWLNMVGCTTPGWLSEHFPEYAIRGGFTSRTIFLYADAKRHHIAYPARRAEATAQAELKADLVSDLARIGRMAGGFKLTEEGYKWGEEWYETHWQRPEHEATAMEGYRARKQTHIHKLAMVLSASESSNRLIELRHLQAADGIVSSLEADMPETFNEVTDNRGVKCLGFVLKVVKNWHKERACGIEKRELWRRLCKLMSHDEFTAAVQGGTAAHYLKEGKDSGNVVRLFWIKKEEEE